jgi:hypothetical protein
MKQGSLAFRNISLIARFFFELVENNLKGNKRKGV